MSVQQFLLILLARKKTIVATLLLTTALAVGFCLMQGKTYKATASVLLNYKGVDPLTGMTMPGQLLPGYMATQVDIIGSKNVALRVVDALRLAANPTVAQQFRAATGGHGAVRDWLAEVLLTKLEIVPARESSVVEISFMGSDPAFAAAVANAFADEYQKITVQLKTDPAKKTAAYFNDQTRQLRDDLEAAQARLSRYQQEKGIVSLDNSRADVELARLNDLSAQLVAAQTAAMEGDSRQAAAGAPLTSPDVANNALIQSMRANVAVAEGRFADTAQRYGRNHPQYQAAKAELDKVRAELNAALGTVSRSVGANAQVLRQREAELRDAVARQKAKVLEMNRAHDELGALLKDLDSAQRAFDAAAQRLSQTRIEAQSEQADVALLNPAVAPSGPSGPRKSLGALVGFLTGTVLGVGLALLLELVDRRVRSDRDVADVVGIPVLGTVAWKRPRSRRGGRIGGLVARLSARRPLRLN
jgi:polysaccharide biosynthesis transport protein